jgi:hypothetical protein
MHLFNHSCLPNAAFDSHPVRVPMSGGCGGSPAFAMRALVDIRRGEEIYHCYAGSAEWQSARSNHGRTHAPIRTHSHPHSHARCPDSHPRAWAAKATMCALPADCPLTVHVPSHRRPRALLLTGACAAHCACAARVGHPRWSRSGPAVRRQYLLDHHGFECSCPRCTCDDPAEEADMSEQLDRRRCVRDGCGSGLSYPIVPRSTAPPGDAAVRGEACLRCVHCGGLWVDESDEDE